MFGLIVVSDKEQADKLNQSLPEELQAVCYGQDILGTHRGSQRPKFAIIACDINDRYRSHLVEALPHAIMLEKIS